MVSGMALTVRHSFHGLFGATEQLKENSYEYLLSCSQEPLAVNEGGKVTTYVCALPKITSPQITFVCCGNTTYNNC